MRVHGNQISSNIELNGLYGAAEAKLAAERTRKKLMSAALAGVAETASRLATTDRPAKRTTGMGVILSMKYAPGEKNHGRANLFHF